MSRSDEGRRIVAFYESSAPDDRGRFYDEILRFDDERLEDVHDFIQWLFPLRESSGANPGAPRLDEVAIEAFHTRPALRAALRRALDRMLAFYGFVWETDRIVRGPAFTERSGWLEPGNHNHLRLTRIMQALRVLGEPQRAQALYDVLAEIYREDRHNGRQRISERTFEFWTDAVSG
jgi:hypothetical protein